MKKYITPVVFCVMMSTMVVLAATHNPRLINGAVVNTEISLKDIVALSLFSKSGCTAKWAFDQADEFMNERAKRQ